MARAFALKPKRAAVALHHVAHRQQGAIGTLAHGVELPAHHRLGAHGLSAPNQVQVGFATFVTGQGRWAQSQLQKLDVEFIDQSSCQIRQCLQQGKALDPEPQTSVDLCQADRHRPLRLHLAQGGFEQVSAEHVFHGPTGFEVGGGARFQIDQALAHSPGFLANHTQKTAAHGGLKIVKVQHIQRRLHVRQRRSAALGQAVEHLVACRLALEIARDVLHHQHKAAERAVGLHRVHRCHLYAQQLPRSGGGDELRRWRGRAPIHAFLDVLQSVRHQLAVEHAIDGSAQAHQLHATADRTRQSAALQTRLLVVKQDAAIQIAHHHTLREF